MQKSIELFFYKLSDFYMVMKLLCDLYVMSQIFFILNKYLILLVFIYYKYVVCVRNLIFSFEQFIKVIKL